MYATGSASTVTSLMDAMSAFAQANAGMTEVVRRTETFTDAIYGAVTCTVICLKKAASYWWFAYTDNFCTGFIANTSASTTWADITATPASACNVGGYCRPINQPFTSYDFFTDGTCVHVAAQMSNGAFSIFSFGDITKYGTWAGGGHYMAFTDTAAGYWEDGNFNYVTWLFGNGPGNNQGSYGRGGGYNTICIPFIGKQWGIFGWESNAWAVGGAGNGVNLPVLAMCHGPGLRDCILEDTPNVFNNRTAGPRMELFVSDAVANGGTTNLWLPIGYIPNIRAINVSLLNPRDIVNTDWMAFPCQSKQTGVAGQFADTFQYGWAISK